MAGTVFVDGYFDLSTKAVFILSQVDNPIKTIREIIANLLNDDMTQ